MDMLRPVLVRMAIGSCAQVVLHASFEAWKRAAHEARAERQHDERGSTLAQARAGHEKESEGVQSELKAERTRRECLVDELSKVNERIEVALRDMRSRSASVEALEAQLAAAEWRIDAARRRVEDVHSAVLQDVEAYAAARGSETGELAEDALPSSGQWVAAAASRAQGSIAAPLPAWTSGAQSSTPAPLPAWTAPAASAAGTAPSAAWSSPLAAAAAAPREQDGPGSPSSDGWWVGRLRPPESWTPELLSPDPLSPGPLGTGFSVRSWASARLPTATVMASNGYGFADGEVLDSTRPSASQLAAYSGQPQLFQVPQLMPGTRPAPLRDFVPIPQHLLPLTPSPTTGLLTPLSSPALRARGGDDDAGIWWCPVAVGGL